MHTEFVLHEGNKLAYQHLKSEISPHVIFLSGFRSDMTGSKATALYEHCLAHKIGFTRFDYRAHGQSDGVFSDFTIGGALSDVLHIIDSIVAKPVILIGSSMGGWLMLLAALVRKERVKGLIGIAAAPDFTERLIWEQMTFEQREILENEGEIREPSSYGGELIITRQFLTEAREHLLMDHPIALDIPVRLIQGMQDEDVPWHMALQLTEVLVSEEVELHLIKDGDHRLSRPSDIAFLLQVMSALLAQLSTFETSK